MPSRFELPHLDITPFAQSQPYTGSGLGGDSGTRIREEHGRRLQSELRAALTLADEQRPRDARLDPPIGTFLEVELRRGAKVEVLEFKKSDVRPGAVKTTDTNERMVALFVPDHARVILDQILDDYLNGPLTGKAGNPPNKSRVEAVEAIRKARLETFWTDDPRALPTDPHIQMWWALWCWAGSEAMVETLCARLDVRAAGKDRRLYFPEIVVIPVLATRSTIELMLFATDAIAELRRASDSPVFFTEDVRHGQHEWTDNLAARIVWPSSDVPAVCLFDTGVNRAHALIEPALAPADLHTLVADWHVFDHDRHGHGTAMAGLALHGDLTAALADSSERRVAHRLESVKVLPPDGFDTNDPHGYGVLTQSAIARPEITAPGRSRVYCMAVTNTDISGAIPSSWSGAIDQAAAGAMIGDEPEAPRRLIVVAAGNIPAETDPGRLLDAASYPVEDPPKPGMR